MSNQANPLTETSTRKAKDRVTNWPEYGRALVQRGRLLIWFDEAFLRERWHPAPTDKRGAIFMVYETHLCLNSRANPNSLILYKS